MSETDKYLSDNEKSTDLTEEYHKHTKNSQNLFDGVYCNYTNFKSFIDNTKVYVDKTCFITDVLMCPEKALLITRPSGFGKSLNLNMLASFLSVSSTLEKSYYEIQNIRKNESISNKASKNVIDDEVAMKHFKKHSIINISLSTCCGPNYKAVASRLRDYLLKYFYENFSHLRLFNLDEKYMTEFGKRRLRLKVLKSSELIETFENCGKKLTVKLKKRINKEQRRYKLFSSFLELEGRRSSRLNKKFEQDPESYIIEMLKSLVNCLHKYFKKTLFIIIDDYDRPVNFLNGKGPNLGGNEVEIEKVARLITKLISTLAGLEVVSKVIVAGQYNCLDYVYGEDIKNFGIADPYFTKSFGFTELEVKEQILSRLQLSKSQANLVSQIIKTWYGSYLIPSSNSTTLNVYSPFVVIRYIQSLLMNHPRSFIPFPAKQFTGSCSILSRLSSLQIGQDLEGKLYSLALNDSNALYGISFLYKHNFSISETITNESDCYDVEQLVSYILLNGGYLTLISVLPKLFKIPNQDIKQHYTLNILKFIQERYMIDLNLTHFAMIKMISYMYRCDQSKLGSALMKFMSQFSRDLITSNDLKVLLIMITKTLELTHYSRFEESATRGNSVLYLVHKLKMSKEQRMRGVSLLIIINELKSEDEMEKGVRQSEHYMENKHVIEQMKRLAQSKGCSRARVVTVYIIVHDNRIKVITKKSKDCDLVPELESLLSIIQPINSFFKSELWQGGALKNIKMWTNNEELSDRGHSEDRDMNEIEQKLEEDTVDLETEEPFKDDQETDELLRQDQESTIRSIETPKAISDNSNEESSEELKIEESTTIMEEIKEIIVENEDSGRIEIYKEEKVELHIETQTVIIKDEDNEDCLDEIIKNLYETLHNKPMMEDIDMDLITHLSSKFLKSRNPVDIEKFQNYIAKNKPNSSTHFFCEFLFDYLSKGEYPLLKRKTSRK